MKTFARCLLLLIFTDSAQAAVPGFGLQVDEKRYIISSGAGLEFSVLRDSGSIPSLKFNGIELNGPKTSGIASGLGPTGTLTKAVADDRMIIVTVSTDATNPVATNLMHYYIVRKGENTLHMATHAEKEPNVGELRWITRMKSSLFPNAPKGSDLRGTTGYIESQDIFGMPDKTTRSKYYGNERAMDLHIRGLTGQGVGVFMHYGSRESSAGGPFFRDIQNQVGENHAEVYNYMNSGHAQTEPLRLGVLQGPYALMFTDGSTPEIPDMSFIASLGLKGYVGEDQRGSVKLEGIQGRDAKHNYTLVFASPTAQYWAKAAEVTTCSGMKPGDYTMSLHKGELSVHTAAVTVKAGETTTLPAITLTADPSQTPAHWRIGDWDGTPLEFRNGSNIPLMHPSDVRQPSWKCGDFTLGSSVLADFPACQWTRVNNGQVVRFTLTKEQITACELRIGITASIAGGRPRVLLNQWESKLLQGVRQPDSRTFTIGTYRGRNVTYTFKVPAKAFVAGPNVLTINVVSGQGGEGFLSPGYTIDCIDLCPAK